MGPKPTIPEACESQCVPVAVLETRVENIEKWVANIDRKLDGLVWKVALLSGGAAAASFWIGKLS